MIQNLYHTILRCEINTTLHKVWTKPLVKSIINVVSESVKSVKYNLSLKCTLILYPFQVLTSVSNAALDFLALVFLSPSGPTFSSSGWSSGVDSSVFLRAASISSCYKHYKQLKWNKEWPEKFHRTV